MKRARGMTLLEVLIATTILASLTVIVAMLWAQTGQWTEETRTHDSALRLQRTLDLLDRQWGARVTNVTLADGAEGAVIVDGERLEFITASSALFPDWPLVRAAYIARPVGDASEQSWTLDYEEVRLGTTFNAGTEITLGEAPEGDAAIDFRGATLLRLDAQPRWSAVLSDAQISDWRSSNGVAPTDDEAEVIPRWIGLTDPDDTDDDTGLWAGLERANNPEAVRLDGTTKEGGFRWALAGRPLR